jgi:hypothetical protein
MKRRTTRCAGVHHRPAKLITANGGDIGSEAHGSQRISPSCHCFDGPCATGVQRCDVDPATTDPCFRKPSLIACLIPSSINVLATSGTLVPCVPSLDSWSKNPQVPTARVTGRRSVSAINQRHHTQVNGVFFRLEKESKSIHCSLKGLWQQFQIRKGAAQRGRPVEDRKILPLLTGAEAEALCRQGLCCASFFRKSPNERLGSPDLGMIPR